MNKILPNLQHSYKWIRSSLGFNTKITLMTVFLVVFMGCWTTGRAYFMTLATLRQQLEMRGISIARDVAARSMNYIFTNNLYELHRLIQDTLENNTDIAYIFFQDTRGRVLVHSFYDHNVPEELRAFNQVPEDQRSSLVSFESEQGTIYDIAVPVFGGIAGTVRIGMSEEELRQTTGSMVLSLMSSVGVAFMVALAVAYLITGLLLIPLLQLTVATRKIARGNFDVRVPHSSRDELGQLASSFNLMAERLSKYEQENLSSRAELERKERLRINLVKRLINAQEEERKRIARELHDEAAQSLTAMKLGLKVIENTSDPEDLNTVTAEFREILDMTLENLASLARDLRPSVLDDMGLEVALARYIEKSSSWLDTRIEFFCEGLDKQRLPSYMETAVYRIVQEALTNIKKYARAEKASVLLRLEKQKFSVIIEDDGVGFIPDQLFNGTWVNQGLGLFGMQERAALMGGTLRIQSAPGNGTTIILEIPVQGEISDRKTDWNYAG